MHALCVYRRGLYATQIVKCLDPDCCSDFRSDLLRILPERFLPPPVAIKNDSGKVVLDVESDNKSEYAGLFLNLQLKLLRDDAPYDFCAPSARNKMADRTCPSCRLSFPSKAAMLRHRRALHFRSRERLPEDWQQQLESCTQDISRVINEKQGSFLCVLTDGSLEWQELHENDYRVNKFRAARLQSMPVISIINSEEWARGLLIE